MAFLLFRKETVSVWHFISHLTAIFCEKIELILFFMDLNFVNFWLKFLTSQKVTQNSNLYEILNFQPILMKFWYLTMPGLLNIWVKFQSIWFSRSWDICSFMGGTFKYHPVFSNNSVISLQLKTKIIFNLTNISLE